MSLDLQKVTIRRLLETQNHDLYSKLVAPYFSGANSIVYNKIQSFYKANMRIPSLEENATLPFMRNKGLAVLCITVNIKAPFSQNISLIYKPSEK